MWCSDRCERYEQKVRTVEFIGSRACYCSLASAARVCCYPNCSVVSEAACVIAHRLGKLPLKVEGSWQS